MTRIFAHRGYSAAFPENTALAFREALKTGCHGIEMDVQLTRDGELVVIHDETVDRTTDGSGRVRDLSLEELRRLDASAGFGNALGKNPIPTLDEYLDIVETSDVVINIELKNGTFAYPGLAERVARAVSERGLSRRAIFSSFNHQSLLACKRISPDSELAFIESSWLLGAGVYCAANGADYLNPRFAFLTYDNLAELSAHGVRAQAWTVDAAEETRRLADLGVDSIITNDPAAAMRLLTPGS
ncbi:MAG: glycerophosphodiester phosphodiesterase [Spirochaetes bacterium]|nr:glycerophosphodiester phosphodiesterase [Spirochaetota bacterium]MBU1079520.1 glycerophosphodiester phosphodiesterase [Spirochaetota bacterium]